MEVSAKRWPSRGLARLARNKHKSSEAYLAAARRTPKIKYHTFRPLRPPFTHPPVHPSFHALADNAANKISLPPPRNYNKHIKSTKYIYIYIETRLFSIFYYKEYNKYKYKREQYERELYELALDREKKKKGKKKSATFGAKSGQKKKERRSEKKKKKRQRGTNLFPSLPTEKTDRERERRREEGGGEGQGWIFCARRCSARCRAKARSRCNEARYIGRREEEEKQQLSLLLGRGGKGWPPPRSVIRQVGIHIYRVVKSIGGVR